MISLSPSRTLRSLLTCALLAFGALAHAQQVFRITAIPDESPTELARKAEPLMKYLESKLGMPVVFTPVTDYAASVEALINKKVDLAWFGGFTFVQAHVRSGGKVVPVAQREEDERFRSVFITGDPAIQTLADLKGKDVSFGSQSSTSVDTAKVRAFYTTPPYYDYNWTVHADMPAALREKLTQALLSLSRDSTEGKQILDLQRATRFVPTRAENYKGIEAAARSAGLL